MRKSRRSAEIEGQLIEIAFHHDDPDLFDYSIGIPDSRKPSLVLTGKRRKWRRVGYGIAIYAGDITKLSDSELKTLDREIEESEAWSAENAAPDSWEGQAQRRSIEIMRELNGRWEAANPEEAARRHKANEPMAKIMAAQMEATRNFAAEMFTRSITIGNLLRGRQ